jgi:hypothetical protein
VFESKNRVRFDVSRFSSLFQFSEVWREMEDEDAADEPQQEELVEMESEEAQEQPAPARTEAILSTLVSRALSDSPLLQV